MSASIRDKKCSKVAKQGLADNSTGNSKSSSRKTGSSDDTSSASEGSAH